MHYTEVDLKLSKKTRPFLRNVYCIETYSITFNIFMKHQRNTTDLANRFKFIIWNGMFYCTLV